MPVAMFPMRIWWYRFATLDARFTANCPPIRMLEQLVPPGPVGVNVAHSVHDAPEVQLN